MQGGGQINVGARLPVPGAHSGTHPARPLLPATLSFHAVNINLAVGGFLTIVSLGQSALHCYLPLVCRGGNDFVSLL